MLLAVDRGSRAERLAELMGGDRLSGPRALAVTVWLWELVRRRAGWSLVLWGYFLGVVAIVLFSRWQADLGLEHAAG
jgi:hypothetical protein